MLYQFHEINRTLLNPLVQWADASSKLFSNPVSPLAHTPFAQRIAAGYELMYRLGKDYEKPPFDITTTTVEGKTLAVIGVGHIGGGAAEQAKQLGMRVIGIRRTPRPHPAVDEMFGPRALHKVLARADIVLLNTALTSHTRFLMGRREFALMKPGAGFINMSRGGLVDPQALEEALRTGHLGGAMIDVSYPEPLPADASLWDAPNLIITPHVLSDDIEHYIPRTLDIFFDNIRRYIAGKPLRNVVDLKREY